MVPRSTGLALVAGALAALLAPPRAGAPLDPTQDAAQDGGQEEVPDTELGRQMTIVEDGLRLLRRAVRKPERTAEALATLAQCEGAVVASKSQRPAMLPRVPEEEREVFLRDFRLGQVELLEALLALERGLLEGREVEELKALYKAIAALEDPAHERFTEDEDGG